MTMKRVVLDNTKKMKRISERRLLERFTEFKHLTGCTEVFVKVNQTFNQDSKCRVFVLKPSEPLRSTRVKSALLHTASWNYPQFILL